MLPKKDEFYGQQYVFYGVHSVLLHMFDKFMDIKACDVSVIIFHNIVHAHTFSMP